MDSLYITRWPDSFMDVEITGTTVEYLDTGETLFANELFSPGMQLCKWRSRVDYMDQGIMPTLPLLEVGEQYAISAALTADRNPAVQLRITFFDINGDKLDMLSTTKMTKEFTFPEGAVSYEVALINLNHTWIKFSYLMVKKIGDHRHVESQLQRNGGCLVVQPDADTQLSESSVNLQIGRGPLITIEVPAKTGAEVPTVLAYVNDANVMDVLMSLKTTFATVNFDQVTYMRGHQQRFSAETRATIDTFMAQLNQNN